MNSRAPEHQEGMAVIDETRRTTGGRATTARLGAGDHVDRVAPASAGGSRRRLSAGPR